MSLYKRLLRRYDFILYVFLLIKFDLITWFLPNNGYAQAVSDEGDMVTLLPTAIAA